MKTKKIDPLYDLLSEQLFTSVIENETSEELIERVVKEFMQTQFAEHSIPHPKLEALKTDLTEEVREMYRKKTYGHFNLHAFRKAIATGEKTAPVSIDTHSTDPETPSKSSSSKTRGAC